MGEGAPGSQGRKSGTRTCIISFCLVRPTSLSAEREDSRWAKPAFLLKLSSAFPLPQTCSCLLLHGQEQKNTVATCSLGERSAMAIAAGYLKTMAATSNQDFWHLFLFFFLEGCFENSARVISYCRNRGLMGTMLSFLDLNHSPRFKMNSAYRGTRVGAPGNFFISKGYAGCVLACPCCLSTPAVHAVLL